MSFNAKYILISVLVLFLVLVGLIWLTVAAKDECNEAGGQWIGGRVSGCLYPPVPR